MRYFVTGAAGFIGSATTEELVKNGHQVLGLARSDASAEKIKSLGAESHTGHLEDLESLKSGAKASDGVVHLAFVHDFTNMANCTAIDRAAIEAMGEVLAGTGKPLIIASGTLSLSTGEVGTEDMQADRNHAFSDRAKADGIIAAVSKEKNVRGMVMRFSPTVHDKGDKGLIPMLVNVSREKGTVMYTGDGSARWPAVHREDAAALLRLALEKGKAGATYHAVAEQGVSMKDITAVIGNHLNLPVKESSVEEAMPTLGFLAHMVNIDNPISSEKTRKELAWEPTRPGLLEDMAANYF